MTTVHEPTDTARAAYIDGLRQIADWLEQHPEVPTPYLGSSVHSGGTFRQSLSIYLYGDNQRDELATIARAMGKAEKSSHDRTGQFYVWRAFGGIDVVAGADRGEVCERVVTATREVTEEVPDPQALAAIPKVTVTRTEETVEWVCGSILAGAAVSS